jgi:amino acid transporter
MFALYSPIVSGPICAYLGFILEGELKSNYGWDWFHWWMFVIVALPALAALAYFGIKISVRTIVVVGALEFLIVLALGVWGLANPGPGGFTVRSFDYGFNPGNIATASGFALAIVFTVQGLTGWEAAVPLAEETENPRRNIPRAIMASIAIIGIMLIVVIWGQIIGWGVNDLDKLTASPELPALVIAHRVWGGLWFLALLAMFTSVIGASLACQNVATRMWYRMGRAGVLPSALGTVHPNHKTPTVAIFVQFVLSVLLGLGAAAIWGPDKIFVLTVGFVLVIGVIFVYVLANLGVVLYYWRERRQEFNPIYHLVFPVGTSLVLIYSLYASFNPFPASPYNLSPFIVGAWLLIGVGVLVALRARGNEAWLKKAGEIVEERRETPEELAHRSAI